MVPGELQVSPEELQAHARSVRQVGEEVALARAAGGHVALGWETYGVLCQFMYNVVDDTQQAAVDAFGEMCQSLGEVALALEAAAAGFDLTDLSSAEELSRPPPGGSWEAF
jgi:hypothetical protein